MSAQTLRFPIDTPAGIRTLGGDDQHLLGTRYFEAKYAVVVDGVRVGVIFCDASRRWTLELFSGAPNRRWLRERFPTLALCRDRARRALAVPVGAS